MAFCMVCPVALADSSETANNCEHDWIVPTDHYYSIPIPGEDLDVGIEVEQCSKCGLYKHTANYFFGKSTYYSLLPPHRDGMIPSELITYWGNKLYNTLGQNASVKQYETGGGSAGTGGVGRRPSGYADDKGTPTVGPTGVYSITVNPTIEIVDNEHCSVTITGNNVRFADFDDTYFASNYTHPIRVYFTTTALADGKFSVPYTLKQLAVSYSGSVYSGSVYLNGRVTNYLSLIKLNNGTDFSDGSQLLSMEGKRTVSQGSKVFFVYAFSFSYDGLYPQINKSFTSTDYANYTFYPLTLTFTPSESNKQTNITINQNTWNGNIYQDNSTNLTYIYPQYTTINENNETVTNISENPIIYNNETKEYYTYDSVTNNYYYITYVTETPTPTPSPDPTPTPDPGTDPTPTPEPGGNTGDTTGILAVLVEIRDNLIQGFADLKATLVQGWADLSANFTLAIENLNLNITNIFNKKFPDQSTPETAQPSPSPSPDPSPSPTPDPDNPDATPTPTPPTTKPSGDTNNFWNFVFPGGNDDGTENGHKGILWALISLLIAVVTFVLGLGSAYSYVFPFLPAGLVTTIHICVLVLLLFAIIKFVRSFL